MLTRKIPLKVYLSLILISVVHTEIMAGTTDLTHFITNPLLAWSNILFYGLSLIIYVDLAHRFNLDAIEIFLLGLTHGVVEEGIALWTFFFQRPELSSTMWLGINLNWAILVTLGEVLLLPVLGILFARIVFPLKKGEYLISKRGYKISGTILVLLIVFYNLAVAGFSKQVPKALPYFLTWLVLVCLVALLIYYHRKVKQWLHGLVREKRPRPKKIYAILTLLVFSAYAFCGFVLSEPLPVMKSFLIPILTVIPLGLLLTFTAWSDSQLNPTKLATVFITLLLLFTLAFIAQRSPQNTVLLAVVVTWEIVTVIKSVKLQLNKQSLSS